MPAPRDSELSVFLKILDQSCVLLLLHTAASTRRAAPRRHSSIYPAPALTLRISVIISRRKASVLVSICWHRVSTRMASSATPRSAQEEDAAKTVELVKAASRGENRWAVDIASRFVANTCKFIAPMILAFPNARAASNSA